MMTTSPLRVLVTSTLNHLLAGPLRSSLLSDLNRRSCSGLSVFSSYAKMSTVFVKNFEDDERLQISVDLVVPSGATKSINLNRLKNEELRIAVDRLRLNLTKKMAKKGKQKKKKNSAESNSDAGTSEPEEEIPIEIALNGSSFDLTVPNENAWIEGATLKVGEEEIPIVYNPPGVKLEKLPATIMEGFPLFPQAELEFTDMNSCEFYWKTIEPNHVPKVKSDIAKDILDLTDAVKAHSYTPEACDMGKYVLLACIPKSQGKEGKMAAVVSPVEVTPGPGPCPFEKRHEFTRERTDQGHFRVLSYNLLAEIYADTDFARDELFSHCPPYALDMSYRKHLLLKEIIGYQGDLLCMQEVDKSLFTSQLTPALSSLGYTGLFRPKTGSISEGCATFVRQDKFRVDNELDIVLSEFLATDPLCADIWTEICKVEPLRQKLEERSSILQVTVLESAENPGNYIALANTHLFFHPTACNIRLIHAAVAMRHLQSICDSYTQEGKNISVIFCGDFNSAPHLGVYQLMTAQFVPADHVDWSSGGKEEFLTSLELNQPMNIISAYGTPPFTNFTRGFQATLDYIFVDSDKLEVTRVVPLPDREEVSANIALPSKVFPSDHLALVCDIKYR